MSDLINGFVRGKNSKDIMRYGLVQNSTLASGNGEDSVSITYLTGSILDLGNDDDTAKVDLVTLSQIKLGSGNDKITIGGFGSLLGKSTRSTIDGGSGSDELNVGLRASQIGWSYIKNNKMNGWLISDYDHGGSGFLTGIETVAIGAYKYKLTYASAHSAASINLTGIDDNFSATLGPVGYKINLGDGNDAVTLVDNWDSGTKAVTIDGGAGTDTLKLPGPSERFTFSLTKKYWTVNGTNASGDYFGPIAILSNVERATLIDSSIVYFKTNGLEWDASKADGPVNLSGTDPLDQNTAGNDTLIGSKFNDILNGFNGSDLFDLRRGGRDLVEFNSEYYKSALTKVTIQGYSADDNIKLIGNGALQLNLFQRSNGIWTGTGTITFDKAHKIELTFTE